MDPNYAGEPVEIAVVNPRDPNGGPLDNSNATARVTIVETNADGTDGPELVSAAPMPWAATQFLYVWATGGRPPGAYRAKVEIIPTASPPSWRYLDIVLEAPPTAPLLPFGSTVDDVKALLPHRRWTPGTKPDVGDVERFLVSAGSILNVALVPPPADPNAAERLARLARRAVVYGAAAQAEAAATPERARPNDESSYAAWLQARYLEAVDAAETFYDDLAAGDIPGSGDLDAEPAWSFPEPAGWAARGI